MPLASFPELETAGGIIKVVTPDQGSIFLRRRDGEKFDGVSAICTHQGCAVSPAGAGFRCPCHGSTFDEEGKRTGGPAPRPLQQFRAERQGDFIVLYLSLLLVLLLPLWGCEHGGGGGAGPQEFTGDQPAFPLLEHVEQSRIRRGDFQFHALFEQGDELFGAQFNALDGSGALALPDGTPLPGRFSRVPPGGGRFTGPNAQACEGCHNAPLPTSAGEAASNVLQDPAGLGSPPFNGRNTTSLFGIGAIQRLAEEMTEDLLAIREQASTDAEPGGAPVTAALESKGVSFGSIVASRDGAGSLTLDVSGVQGVGTDLVVRALGWKGNTTTIRDFCRGAAMNELGMEADELVAKDSLARQDPDGDGVEGELSVGDITAITVYVASQEIPQPIDRLVRDGFLAPPSDPSTRLTRRGRQVFSEIGCSDCHVPELRLLDPAFEEPTRRGGGAFLDPDIDPVATALDPDRPFKVHLVREGDFPRLEPHPAGGARVALFGDLKRHVMGAQLADAQATPVKGADGRQLEVDGSAVDVPEDVFLTAELWGVGSTGPWLHDGRAGTIEDAILLHGEDSPPAIGDPARSEAQESRDAFAALAGEDRLAVVEFLRSLVLFSLPETADE